MGEVVKSGSKSITGAIGKVVGGLTGATQQAEAAQQAAGVQAGMASEGIAEQRRQFDALQRLMSPYVMSGNAAMQQQLALLGLEMRPVSTQTGTQTQGAAGGESTGITRSSGGGFLSPVLRSLAENVGSTPGSEKTSGGGVTGKEQQFEIVESADAQKRAIAALEQSPFFQSMYQQGENAMLQQASATGGLRGGNIQGALAQFRPGLLNQMVQQRFSQLGGLTQIGQASASGQAAQGMQSAGAIGDLLAQMGAAQAGGIMAKGGINRTVFNDAVQIGGMILGAGGGGARGGAGGGAGKSGIF
jgi:hypothetical protein